MAATHYELNIRGESLLELSARGVWRRDMPTEPPEGEGLAPLRELDALYNPGYGGAPPLLAGRDDAVAKLRGMAVLPLRQGRTPGRDMAIWAPRGLGKTVLLGLVGRMAAEPPRDGERPILVLEVQPGKGADAIRPPNQGKAWRSRAMGVQFTAPSYFGGGGFGATLGAEAREQPDLDRFLAQRLEDHSVLLLADEAHRLDQEAGRTLFDALQSLRRDASGAMDGSGSVMALFAGTPDLPDHFRKMDVTYWDRMGRGRMPLNLIGPNAVAQAVLGPLVRFGRVLPEGERETKGLFERAGHLCNGHPYFTQCLGEALHAQLLRKDQAVLDAALMDRAESEFSAMKEVYYQERWEELDRAGLAEAACHLIAAFRSSGGKPLLGAHVRNAAEAGLEMRAEFRRGRPNPSGWVLDSEAAATRLLHSGFIWSENGLAGDLAPGIPCLHWHVREQARKSHGRDLVAEIAAQVTGQ